MRDSEMAKQWRVDGKYHREDGPAITWEDGEEWWCLDNVRYNFNEFVNTVQVSAIDKTALILRYGPI